MAGMKVLVTGGAGFIGSHVTDAYVARGAKVWVLDNLSSGRRQNLNPQATFVEADIRDDDEVAALFRDAGGFDLVNHHAAQIDVRKSVNDPRYDASINVDGLLNLTERSREHGVRRFVFVSSGGVVYGEPDVRPTPERMPKLPKSPYGVTKLVGEHYLHYYASIHGLEYVALRYSNVFGPRQDPHGEAGVVAIFCNRLLADTPLTIFGDGEQTRDYVFVGDVVRANLTVGDMELDPPTDLDVRGFNVGTGRETSVNELARTLMRASGREVPLDYAPARPGELQHSCLDTSSLRKRGWDTQTTLEQGLKQTFDHIASNR